MNPIAPLIERNGIVILDGALATELERRGADLRDPLWSAKVLLETPELIRQVHLDYYNAGADIVTTASYQATIPGLMRRGLSREQAADLLRLSVRLAQGARDEFLQAPPPHPRPLFPGGERGEILVAASIGPYGAYLHDGSEYRGDYGLSVKELIDWHRPRVEVLASSGADLLACETVPSLVEAEALVRLLSEFPHMPAWISFSCRDEQRLCHGEPFAEAIQLACASPNIVAAGVNCTSPRFIDGLLASVSGVATKPLVVYPNSGETWDGAGQTWQGASCEPDWTSAVQCWHRAGARIIGGCCRTTPETIRTIAECGLRNAD